MALLLKKPRKNNLIRHKFKPLSDPYCEILVWVICLIIDPTDVDILLVFSTNSQEAYLKNLTGRLGLLLGLKFLIFLYFSGFEKDSLTFRGLRIFYLFFLG